MRRRNRASALLVTILILMMGAVIAAGIGYTYVGSTDTPDRSESVSQSTSTSTPSPESRDVEVIYEQWDDKIYVAINGGSDVENITSITVTGADMNAPLDPDSDYPEARGTIDAPTTVTVEATFEDGTTVVVAEWNFG